MSAVHITLLAVAVYRVYAWDSGAVWGRHVHIATCTEYEAESGKTLKRSAWLATWNIEICVSVDCFSSR